MIGRGVLIKPPLFLGQLVLNLVPSPGIPNNGAQDRRAWGASVLDIGNSIGDAGVNAARSTKVKVTFRCTD